MTDHRAVEAFQIEIPRRFAYRLLGLGRSGRAPRPSIMVMFEEELAIATGLVDAKAVMCYSHEGLLASTQFDPRLSLVAVVCTIGPALEDRVTELANAGETARAAVLDAIGSAAAEEVADQSNRLICELAAPTDLTPGQRVSPGYGTWDIRDQRLLFELVGPDDIGVRLTASGMMVPRKSISYVVPLDGKPGDADTGGRCAHCGAEDCTYRDADDVETVERWLEMETRR
jgi:hypothetical protein